MGSCCKSFSPPRLHCALRAACVGRCNFSRHYYTQHIFAGHTKAEAPPTIFLYLTAALRATEPSRHFAAQFPSSAISVGMSGVKCRKWILMSHFSGLPKREDLELVEEEIPALKNGGEVFRAKF